MRPVQRYVSYNANPDGNRVGDCTVRAISAALGKNWEETYTGLALQGYIMHDMPSADHVWGAYLRNHDFERHIIPGELPDDYTVVDFCKDNPDGDYILAIAGHVVFISNGKYYDSWDSGNEIPLYYWKRKEIK